MRCFIAAMVMLIGFAGCGKPTVSKDGESSSAVDQNEEIAKTNRQRVDKPKTEPRFWQDKEGAELAKYLLEIDEPGDKVNLIRWEGGWINGWVKFDSDQDVEAAKYDLTVPPDNLDFSGDETSGWILVVMRKLKNEERDIYDVNIDRQFVLFKTGVSENEFYSWSGKAKRYACPPKTGTVVVDEVMNEGDATVSTISTFGDDYFQLERRLDGKSVPWLKISFEPR